MSTGAISTGEGLMASTVAVAFAYEGWILATSINAELRDAKRTPAPSPGGGLFLSWCSPIFSTTSVSPAQ